MFEQIDPPSGGLNRLRARLREEERRSWRRLAWLAPVALSVATLLAVLGRPAPGADLIAAASNPALLRYGLGAAAGPSQSIEVPTDEAFVFYWVAPR